MKKIMFVLILAAAAAFAANAQDVITKVDGTQINAKVIEITPGTVKYNRADNPDGPVYVVYISDISTIKYENGLVETYNDLASDLQVKSPAESYPQPRLATPEEVAAAEEAERAQQAAPEEAPAGNDEPWWEYEPERTSVYSIRYRDIRDHYNPREYVSEAGDPYIPVLSGLASFFLPGLGQCIDGEWGRGVGIVATNMALGVAEWFEAAAMWYSLADYQSYYKNGTYNNYYGYGRSNGMFAASLGAALLTLTAQTAFNIWNIVDAVDIAKVKNMYYHDSMYRRRASLDMNLTPQLAMVPSTGGSFQPAAGFSLKVSF